jgi:hypothetical protein
MVHTGQHRSGRRLSGETLLLLHCCWQACSAAGALFCLRCCRCCAAAAVAMHRVAANACRIRNSQHAKLLHL